MKPAQVKSTTYTDSSKKINDKDPKFKIGDIGRISNIKTFLQMVMFQIGLKKSLLLQKLKVLFRGHMILVILKANKLLEHFTKKSCKT